MRTPLSSLRSFTHLPGLSAIVLLGLLGAPTAALADAPTARAKLKEARAAYDRGDWSSAAKLFEAAHRAAPAKSPERAEAALEWSSLSWEQGEYVAARKRASEALETARALKLDAAIGRLLLTIGHIEMSQGQLGRARSTFRTCVQITTEQKDKLFGALCQMNLSNVRRAQGKAGMSEGQMKRAIAQLKGAGKPLTTATALAKTGELFEKRKDWKSAMVMYAQASALYKTSGSVPAQARHRLRVARALQVQGRWGEAKTELNTALPQLRKMNSRPAMFMAYGLLGRQAQKQGQRAEALQHYQRAMNIARQTKNPQHLAQGHLALCEVLTQPTPQRAAISHCTHAAARFKALGVHELYARATVALGGLEQAQGRWMEARKQYLSAINTLETRVSPSLRDGRSIAMQRANLCQVEMNLKRAGVVHTCRAAIKALKGLKAQDANTQRAAAISHYAAGTAARREKSLKAAVEHLHWAAEGFKKLSPPDHRRAADAAVRLGAVYARIKNGDASAEKAFLDAEAQLGKVPGASADGTRLQLHTQRAQLLMRQSRDASALADLEAILKIAPTLKQHDSVAWAHNNVASIKLQKGDQAAAIKHLEQALVAAKKAKDKPLQKLIEGNLKKFRAR